MNAALTTPLKREVADSANLFGSGSGLTPSIFHSVTPDPIGRILETGFFRFHTQIGISGLAKAIGDKLELLMIESHRPGRGAFRDFIALCKANYTTICVWFDENPVVHGALGRYGFRPDVTIDRFGDTLRGMRWDLPLKNSG